MNTYRKGKMLEKRAREILEKNGYKILTKSVFVRYQNIDFAGLFDIVACKGKRWVFIQVKSKKDNKQLREIKKFAEDIAPLNCVCEMWVWNPKKKDFEVYVG